MAEKMKIGEADTLRIMMEDEGLDPKEGCSEVELEQLGFEKISDTHWKADGLTVVLEDGRLSDYGDR